MKRTLNFSRFGALWALAAFSLLPALGQQISDSAAQQMKDILRVKNSWTRGQKKMSSALLFGAMKARNQSIGAVPNRLFKTLESN